MVDDDLGGFDRDVLDAHSGNIVAVDPQLRIRFVNSAWRRFAAENGGEPQMSRRWGVGASLMDAIPEALHEYYRRLFRRVLRLHGQRDLRPPSHEYECSTPDTFRRYAMTIYPLPRQAGLLLVHTLRTQVPIEGTPGFQEAAAGDAYVAHDGLVRQCACCRRVRSVQDQVQWHWIRDWVRLCADRISHTLCPLCSVQYYGAQ